MSAPTPAGGKTGGHTGSRPAAETGPPLRQDADPLTVVTDAAAARHGPKT